jgi:hypothetical protein
MRLPWNRLFPILIVCVLSFCVCVFFSKKFPPQGKRALKTKEYSRKKTEMIVLRRCIYCAVKKYIERVEYKLKWLSKYVKRKKSKWEDSLKVKVYFRPLQSAKWLKSAIAGQAIRYSSETRISRKNCQVKVNILIKSASYSQVSPNWLEN